jgi:hypothetical protein
MQKLIANAWNFVFDHEVSPLRHIPNVATRHMILQILGWMWAVAFAVAIGSYAMLPDDAINILQRLPFNMIFKNAYDDKSIQEALIAASDLEWLIVRPGVLMNCPSSGNYSVLTRPSEWRNGIVARADVADFIVKRIEANALNREKPVIIRYPL